MLTHSLPPAEKNWFRPSTRCRLWQSCAALSLHFWLLANAVWAAPAETLEQCDPKKVISADACVRCHAREAEVWKRSEHFHTFDTLQRNPNAKAIANRLGISSVKRSGECIRCHYTPMQKGETVSLVAGVSCESCHGAARDWVNIHSNYGGLGITAQLETPEHRQQRRAESVANGMRNPHNLYLMARSCLGCHTVPNERLVNVGGHAAGTADFEFVAWSQGSIKHNFVSNDRDDPRAAQQRLRVMYVVGQVADLEFSTRAIGSATSKQKFGLVVAQRAAKVALQLEKLQAEIKHPLLEEVLNAFAAAELKTNNPQQLDAVADRIQDLGIRLGEELKTTDLTAIDAYLPKKFK